MNIHDILVEAAERNASDVLISAGAPITYHVYGVLEQPEADRCLTGQDCEELILPLMQQDERRKFEHEWELDKAYVVENVSRFRVSVYRQRGYISAVLRLVPLSVPHYTKIGVTEQLLTKMVNIPNGLILVTGPTGAGKSTTIASFMEYLNTEYHMARHIVTIEDPIEYLFESKICVIDQREIGIDTRNYSNGLKAALRQMPHIIFVGEMRDRETIEITLTAAETGNLVISTMSTQSASKTINRIIDVFPVGDQAEIRTRLALNLRGVISQVLMRRKDVPGRIAAREIMFVNNSISNLIREGKIHQIDNVIASSYGEGMSLLDDSLLELFRANIVHKSELVSRLQDPEKARLVLSS